MSDKIGKLVDIFFILSIDLKVNKSPLYSFYWDLDNLKFFDFQTFLHFGLSSLLPVLSFSTYFKHEEASHMHRYSPIGCTATCSKRNNWLLVRKLFHRSLEVVHFPVLLGLVVRLYTSVEIWVEENAANGAHDLG